MLKQIKSLGLVLVILSMLVGCESVSVQEMHTFITETAKRGREQSNADADNKTNKSAEETKQEEKQETKKDVKQEEKQETKKDTKQVEKQDPNKYQGKCVRCGDYTMLDNIMGTCDNCEGYGQCYDCGEYRLISNMTYDGRCYHCGCTPLAECYECGLEIRIEQEIATYFGQTVCTYCYNELVSTRCCGCGCYPEGDEVTVNGNIYCSWCYQDLVGATPPVDDCCWNCGSTNIYSHDAWGNYTCPDCGSMTQ